MSAPKRFRFNIENNENNERYKKIDDWRETAKKISNFVRTTFPQETYYIVQYNKIEDKQLKQLVVNAKNTVVNGFHNDNDDNNQNIVFVDANGVAAPTPKRLQQVFISDDGYVRMAAVIDEATTFEKACELLQQLKKECFDMLFKSPDSTEQRILSSIFTIPHEKFKVKESYLLLQYNCGLDSVIYDVARRSDTVLENDYQMSDILVHINDNDILYQAMIIKSSNNVFELIEDLKLLTSKCLFLKYKENLTDTTATATATARATARATGTAVSLGNAATMMHPISSIPSMQIMRPLQTVPNLPPLTILRPLPIYPPQLSTSNRPLRTTALPIPTEILQTLHREHEIERLEHTMYQESTEIMNAFKALDVYRMRLNSRLNLLDNIIDIVRNFQ